MLQFPGEGRGAEDGGVGLGEDGVDELDLVAPQGQDVLVHGREDRFGEELLAAGQAAEDHLVRPEAPLRPGDSLARLRDLSTSLEMT